MSIDDVARRAGVSTATVSRTLSGRGPVSDRTRAAVTAAAAALGYVVSASASSLASGRMRNIGVLVPILDRWFFSTVISGITTTLQNRGYDTTLYNLTRDPDQRAAVFGTFLRRQRIDGIIAIALAFDTAETEHLAGLGVPTIAIGGPHPHLASLAVDEVRVGRVATEHLLSLGHRRIAHLGAVPIFDGDVPTQRRHGYEQAMADAGIRVTREMFAPADFTVEGGFRVATGLLTSAERPTAIFAASDEMAIGAILAARELALDVPGDLSIVGVDGHDLAGFFRLTTIDQFPLRQGERAATALLDSIEQTAAPDAASPAPLPFDLVVRGSTGLNPRESAP